MVNQPLMFWGGECGPQVTIDATGTAEGRTAVLVTLEAKPANSPGALYRAWQHHALVPALLAPPSARYGSTRTGEECTGILSRDLSLEVVVRHYHAQLEAAGWALERMEAAVWST